MKKSLRFVFFIAVFTGSGIIAFQFYWAYNTYRITADNFFKTASAALQSSIDAYQLKEGPYQSTKPLTASNKVSFYLDTPKALGSKEATKNHQVDLTSGNLKMVQLVLARLASQVVNHPVDLKDIQKRYKAELIRNNINLPFTLSIVKNNNVHREHAIIGYLGFSQNSYLVQADFNIGRSFLLEQTIVPLSISFILILLTAGCLWYMWRIINKQMQLDEIKNNFINNMTHELRTPVAVLRSTHEALDKFGEVADTEKTIRYIRINNTILNKLENNIDRILDITQYEKGAKFARPESVGLKNFIAEIIQRFTLAEDVNISLTYNMEKQDIVTDRYIIDTIVSNLVDNAVKYAEGEVNVDLIITNTDNGWQLQVQDNGKGIEAKYLPFIFDKFYRVPTGNLHDTKGFGLGLNYVKELTAILQGKLMVQSKPGTGTTFTIQFPFLWAR